MGHSPLQTLRSGAELWTGDGFEYLYVRHAGISHDLPADVLYDELRRELEGKVIAEVEKQRCDWITLAAALNVLRQGTPHVQDDLSRKEAPQAMAGPQSRRPAAD